MCEYDTLVNNELRKCYDKFCYLQWCEPQLQKQCQHGVLSDDYVWSSITIQLSLCDSLFSIDSVTTKIVYLLSHLIVHGLMLLTDLPCIPLYTETTKLYTVPLKCNVACAHSPSCE